MMMTKLIVGVLLGIFHHTLAETFNCYSCTYTVSGDPSIDYECVTQPWNVTKGLPQVSCTTPKQCTTQASLSQESKTIRSVTRSCLPQSAICSGESCCSFEGPYPTCEHKCRSDMCNNRNAENWLKKDKGSGAKGGHHSITSYIVFVVLSVRYFMF